jgi:putative Holliday junction resolvase
VTGSAKRVLGLDLGEVRIGLALSDPLGMTAQPLQTMTRVGPKKDLRALAALAREHDVATVVIGLPLLLSGEEGSKAQEAREFAENLGRHLQGARIELWDERMTTVLAERAMIEGSVRRRKRKEKVDSLAAALILQSYLDSLPGPGGNDRQ